MLIAAALGVMAGCGGSTAGSSGSSDATPATGTGSGAGSGASGGSSTTGGSQPGTSSGTSTAGLSNPNCPLSYTSATMPAAQTGTDPLLASQWHLNNTGAVIGTAGEDLRAFDAWPLTTGAGIRVSVVDDGVETVHPDLAPNVVADASYDYRPGSRGSAYPLPCTSDDSHGTGVAGIIAARKDNAVGGSGVAPGVQLAGLNALQTGTESDVADALTHQPAGNAVSNNSWGSPDDGHLHVADPVFLQAIDDGVRHGRGGRGTVYVFPGGNGGCFAQHTDPGTGKTVCDSDSSNFDGYVNRPGIITACAVDPDGRQPFYGERGANQLVCGPSSGSSGSVRTTALHGGYRTNFSGTSASTPMVSGTAALVLAANPALTYRDVALILASTARQNQPADAEWSSNFGLHYNPKFGFGVVDAGRAVKAAAGWVSVGGRDAQKQCGPYTSTTRLALPDPSASGATQAVGSTIDVTGCTIAHIEFVDVTFNARATGSDADHPSTGDLVIGLFSPAGLFSELAEPRYCYDESGARENCGSYRDFPFGSVRHLNEPAVTAGNGQWTLKAADVFAGNTGDLSGWSITLYGR